MSNNNISVEDIIYLDHHATTPMDPEVLKAMMPYFTEHFGNASSIDHLHGVDAGRAVATARSSIANLINAEAKEIIFTSGATESDNLAIFGLIPYDVVEGKHIITSEIEHKAILESCSYFEKLGGEVTYLPVNQHGIIDYGLLEKSIQENTKLVTIFAANNEVGSIHDLSKIGKITRKHGVFFHTDAVQAIGRVKIDVRKDNIDMLSMSAHKIYGPKGIGALFISKRSPRVYLTPILRGGGQEGNVRSGTLNVPGIVGFGKAAKLIKRHMKSMNTQFRDLQAYLWKNLKKRISDVKLNGPPLETRLPQNLNLYLPGIESKSVIQMLSKKFSISAGSACTTDVVKPSHVLMSMYGDENRAYQSIRIGLGKSNSKTDLDMFIESLVKGYSLLQNMS